MDLSLKSSAIPTGRGILIDTEPKIAAPDPSEIAAAMVSAARLIQLLKHGYFDENIVLLVPEQGLVGGVLSVLNFRVVKEGHSPAAAMWAVHLLIQMEFITLGPAWEGTPEEHWPDLPTMPEAIQESLREDFRQRSAWPPIDDLSTDTPGRDWSNVAYYSTNALWDWIDEGCPSVFAYPDSDSQAKADQPKRRAAKTPRPRESAEKGMERLAKEFGALLLQWTAEKCAQQIGCTAGRIRQTKRWKQLQEQRAKSKMSAIDKAKNQTGSK